MIFYVRFALRRGVAACDRRRDVAGEIVKEYKPKKTKIEDNTARRCGADAAALREAK